MNSQSAAGPDYRPEIDGLRAVAVLGVLLFHLEVFPFSGGYIGVDVFFVVSGYLITRLIRRQLDEGSFTFLGFYARRARRLFPALFFTLCCTFAAAFVLFSPVHFIELGKSTLYCLLSISNFLFWFESGYFDLGEQFKPLLHTWSLGVEEQFYLIWPALLLFLARYTGTAARIATLAILGILSLLLAELMLNVDRAGTFYLLPFRIIEFCLGAILVDLESRRPRGKLRPELMAVSGLALIIIPMLYYTEETRFPGLTALVPCAGTALVIFAGRTAYSGWMLSGRPLVGLGLVSYSLYLIHWPIIVLYRYRLPDQPGLSGTEQLLLLLGSVAAAICMYYLVEMPLRYPRRPRALTPLPFLSACAFAALLLALPILHAWTTSGWMWRIPPHLRPAAEANIGKQRESWKYVEATEHIDTFQHPDTLNILVMGDSHSKDLFNALYLNPELFEHLEPLRLALEDYCLYRFADDNRAKRAAADLRPQLRNNCDSQMARWQDSKLLAQADVILFAPRWSRDSLPFLPDFAAAAAARSQARLILVARTVEFPDVPTTALRLGNLEDAGRYFAARRDHSVDRINAELRQWADRLGLPLLEKERLICPEADYCHILNDQGSLNFFDYGHWTLEGARFFGQRMQAIGFLANISR